MEKWTGKVAIVTGASSGIGAETCRQLVKIGMIVVGLARREFRLQELQKELDGKIGKFYYAKMDVCSEENILEVFSWVRRTIKSVDVLINNAGVLKACDVLGNTKDFKQTFDTNVIGLSICSREAIKIMEEMKIKGHIININSILGHPHTWMALKDIAIYSATKCSVTGITESLRELMGMKNLSIRVTSISPGIVDTEMVEIFGQDTLQKIGQMKPIDIVDAIIYALSAPERVNVAEIIIRPTNDNILKFMKNTTEWM